MQFSKHFTPLECYSPTGWQSLNWKWRIKSSMLTWNFVTFTYWFSDFHFYEQNNFSLTNVHSKKNYKGPILYPSYLAVLTTSNAAITNMNTWDCKKGKQSPRGAAAVSSFLPFTAWTAEACGKASSRNKGTSTPCDQETPRTPKRRTEQPWSWKKPFTIWNKKPFCLKIPPASIVKVKRQRWVAGKRARWGNKTILCDRGISFQSACFSTVSAFLCLTAKEGVQGGPQHTDIHKKHAVTI